MSTTIDKHIEKAIQEAANEFIKAKMQEIVREAVSDTINTIQKRIEREALEIALMVAGNLRIDQAQDYITISVVKRK